ncbi:MAG: hypothetical protein ACQEP2_04890 [Actinomycetota bacterium]
MNIENFFEQSYQSPSSIYVEKLEKSLEFSLEGVIDNIYKLGRQIFCEVSLENLSRLLKELKENPDFNVNGFSSFNLIRKKYECYTLLGLYSFENNFSILVKTKLKEPGDSGKVIKLTEKHFKPASFYSERVKDQKSFDLNLYSQPLEGMDCFDIYAQLEENIIDSPLIDISISRMPGQNILGNRSFLDLISRVSVFDYNAGIFPELALCMAFEELLQMRVSKRAKFIRMILSELSRISSHLINLSGISQILGYDVVYNLIQSENERVLRLLEFLTGSRKNPNFIRVGGIKNDLNREKIESIRKILPGLEKKVYKIESMLLGNIIVYNRLNGIGIISKNEAIEYGITGPNLRASGIRKDLRKDQDLLLYNKVSFITPLARYGDCFNRFSIRFKEIYQSINILEQITKNLPEGIIRKINNLNNLDFPFKTATARVECPHGMFEVYLETGHKKVGYLAIMGPSINSLILAEKILNGAKLEDINIILSSLDFSCGEIITGGWG